MYMCILHVHWSIHFDKRLFTVLTASLYIKKGDYTKKGRETSMPVVTKNQYRLCLKSTVNMKLSSNESVLSITYEGLTNFQ